MKKKNIITVENLTKIFGSRKVLNELSFEVEKGSVMAFLGSNGSGKTTTIRCLLGIYKPTSGIALINDEPYSSKLSNLIGYLPEERGLYKDVTVEELFRYFFELRGIDSKAADKSIHEYLERVGLLDHISKKTQHLSAGMQQKVQIGLCILHNPEVLILDEPFNKLDPINRDLFMGIFKDLNKNGTTILYSTHIIDEAQKLADSILIIKDGGKKAYGPLLDVRKSFGKKSIDIEFTGTFPTNDILYTFRAYHNKAELFPRDGVSIEEILPFLIEKKLKILNFALDYPTLNEIFIQINNDKT